MTPLQTRVSGKFGDAIIYTDKASENALEQVKTLLDQPCVVGEKVRVMPDIHKGAGCVIGLTMTVNNGAVCPNWVGVDIGCGLLTAKLASKHSDLDLSKFDKTIRRVIPLGLDVHKKVHNPKTVDPTQMWSWGFLKNHSRLERSLGTLGGGNHFIEIDRDSNDDLWLMIHTGSRNLGKQIAEYYQAEAIKETGDVALVNETYDIIKNEAIFMLKQDGRAAEIDTELARISANRKKALEALASNEDVAYLTGRYAEYYLHDMGICQRWASENRYTILEKISEAMGLSFIDPFETVHNYIHIEDKILRKGAVEAKAGQKFVIPLNMRDGVILARGKGNPEWNFSAPHGAGRLYSRHEACRNFTLQDFQKSMQGVFSTSVNTSTIDEAPMAYKDAKEILERISETADVVDILRPVYNLKASETLCHTKLLKTW